MLEVRSSAPAPLTLKGFRELLSLFRNSEGHVHACFPDTIMPMKKQVVHVVVIWLCVPTLAGRNDMSTRWPPGEMSRRHPALAALRC